MGREDDEKTLRSIRSGLLSRGWTVAKLAAGTGLKAGWHQIQTRFIDGNEAAERLKHLVEERASAITSELSLLKGSLMKVGQMLSVYGEALLPPEANAILKKLQSQSVPLAWETASAIYRERLGAERFAALEWDPVPIGSASLGQVHRAREKNGAGRTLALKLRYPGVEKAIDSDLKLLRTLLGTVARLPMTPRLDAVFSEVRTVLLQEVDYEGEARSTRLFGELLAGNDDYIVPQVVDEYCAPGVLATVFEAGVPIDGPEIAGLPQERRDRLGVAFLRLYLEELFVHHRVQTDPHFGNYRVRLGDSREPDRWVLYDFGAVREIPADLVASYHRLVLGAVRRDEALFITAARELGLVADGDSDGYRDTLRDLCYLIVEPFADDSLYDWGKTDLPKRLLVFRPELVLEARLPPGPMLSLDRKTAGVFVVLAKLGLRLRGRGFLESQLGER